MTNTIDIDMQEVRHVCGLAITEYAAEIGTILDDGSTSFGMFSQLETLLRAASAMDCMKPGYTRGEIVERLNWPESVGHRDALREVLKAWVAVCADREKNQTDDLIEIAYLRGERESAQRVFDWMIEL